MAQILFLSSQSTLGVISISPLTVIEQTAVCDPLVYLEAVVIGETAGHSFSWEQISGSPTVTLLSVFGFENRKYYEVPEGELPGSDKVFRFYIDRYTPFEQFMDLTVRTTPFTRTIVLNQGVTLNDSLFYSNMLQDVNKISFSVPYNPSVPFSSVAEFAPDPIQLEFPKPNIFYFSTEDDLYYRDVFVGYVFQSYTPELGWQTFGAVGKDGPLVVAVGVGTTIRIGTIYQKGPGSSAYDVYYSNSIRIESNSISAVERVGLLKYNIQSTSTTDKFIFVISSREEDELIPDIQYNNQIRETVSRIVFLLEEVVPNDDVAFIQENNTNYYFSVTRSSYGGGSIGG